MTSFVSCERFRDITGLSVVSRKLKVILRFTLRFLILRVNERLAEDALSVSIDIVRRICVEELVSGGHVGDESRVRVVLNCGSKKSARQTMTKTASHFLIGR